ncbi:hypothetical protein GCM10008939_22440 [Deinococcus aquiradiocola]|uniref:Uncharacterized protein n=1 Tax=Deinococcus aquiradiocola TaxID=393059 RepID=A0A917PGT2_9DEIO|nr:hypothetical protein GCM10008939_22440 [Deinococcus aquiradiocola]
MGLRYQVQKVTVVCACAAVVADRPRAIVRAVRVRFMRVSLNGGGGPGRTVDVHLRGQAGCRWDAGLLVLLLDDALGRDAQHGGRLGTAGEQGGVQHFQHQRL